MDRGCIALHKVARTYVLHAIYGFALRVCMWRLGEQAGGMCSHT